MQKLSALDYLAGVESTEKTQASAPTNLHVISGEVSSKSEDGIAKVSFDGLVYSEDETQEIEIEALGGLEEGDTVTILLSGEQGHGMTPLALGSVGSIDRIVTNVSEIQADYVKATELEADVAELGYAHITDGVIDNATINVADIDELSATVAEIADAQIANATIEQAQVRNLSVDYASASNLEAATGRISTLESTALTANSATIQNLEADTGKIHNLTANQISAATGYVAALTAGNVTAQNIISDHGDFSTVKANAAKVANLTAQELEADHATVGSLDANYAQIDMANVNNGWITNGTIKNAAIKSQMVESISANQLTAGTIDADEITVQNLKASSLTVQTADGYVYVGEKRIPTKEFLDSLKDELQAEIDGAIETFTVSAIPTLNNTPANEWVVSGDAEATRKLRAKHVGDIAYVINEGSSANGHCYRFAYDNTTQTFGWVLIQDSDVTAALSRISNLETFESNTTSWIEETDEGLTTIRQNHTTLSGKVDKTVVETKQLWYTKSNTTAPGKPTAEVTSTSTSGNAWRVVVPAYNASYPNYYYCLQYKLADGTFAWSAVVRDIAMGESQQQGRKGVSDAATAQTTADNAATAASTADGKAVAAQTTANSNIKSSVQLWFTKSNTTAPNKPTAQVTTNSASTVNAWNLAIPTYNSSYPNYFSCYQQQKGDGTWQWTDVVFDRSITEAQAKAQAALPSSEFTTFQSTTFKNLVDEVDEQSSTITNLTTTVSNKADSSTVTTLSNTVNSVSQTTNSNSQYITNLTTTLGTNADGTSKSEDIVHKYNELDQTLEGTISRVGTVESNVSGLATRMSSAETSIEQNTTDITLTAKKAEQLMTFVPTKHEKAETDFWYSAPGNSATKIGDGWYHYEYTNTGASAGSTYLAPRNWGQVIPGEQYTFLIEVRNFSGASTGQLAYIQQMAGAQFWGGDVKKSYDDTANTSVYIQKLVDGEGEHRFVKVADTEHIGEDTEYDGMCFRCRIYLAAGVTTSFDIRISVYPGDYAGPYNEYLTATSSAQLKVASDEISAKVDKDGVIAAINLSVEEEGGSIAKISADKVNIEGAAIFTSGRLSDSSLASVRLTLTRNNWTDAGWAVYETIGKTDNWNNYHVANGGSTSATGFASNTLRVGDLIVIEGVSKDTDNMHRVTVKVTQVPSGAGSTIPASVVSFVNSNGIQENAKDYANDIQVAGENLLRRTARFVANTWARSNVSVPRAGVLRMNVTSSASPYATYKVNYLDWDDYGTGTYTLSFEARKAPVTSTATVAMVNAYIAFHPISRYDNPVSSGYSRYKPATAINDIPSEWKRYTVTGTCPDEFTTGQASALASGSNLTIHFYIASGDRYPIEIRRVKLENGDVATSYSEAPDDALIPYGGRNLLRGTGTEKTITIASDGTGTYTTNYAASDFMKSLELVGDETVMTYSFDYEVTGTVSDDTYIYPQFKGNAPASGNAIVPAQDIESAYNTVYVKDAMKGHYRCTFVLMPIQADPASASVDTNRIRLYNAGAGATARVWNVKLEQGLVETPWTPAPEDVAADISAVSTVANAAAPKANAIKRTQRIYYRSSSDSKPTVMPSAWVTETGKKWSANNTTASNWTTKVTPIANGTDVDVTKYLYLWTCEQYELASGTIGYTNVLLDDSTTVIDGGKIITGSVTANEIDATDLHVNSANIDGTIAFGKLTNVPEYAMSNDIPTKVSDLSNDSGFQTSAQVESAITGKGYALDSSLTTEINQRKAQYGTCSTATSTTPKVVTCSNFELVAGNELTINFSNANTSAAKIQLNVNSKGAKDVWVANAVTSATNQLLWGAGAYITFRYDGTQFQVIGEPRTWYGASTTAESTAAKTDTTAITGCVICKGTKVELAMTNANTASEPTLNVRSTGAKAVYFGNGTTRPTKVSGTSWLAENTCTFTFDGAAWRTQGKTYIDANSIVTGYISADRIDAGSIAASKLDADSVKTNIVQTTDLSADKIKSGDISADRIKTNVISAINSLSAGTINGERINASQLTIGGSYLATQTDVDNIQIGGTNLLKNSADISACFTNISKVASIVGGQSDPNGGTDAYLITPTANQTSWYAGPSSANCILKNLDVSYTFSIWLRADTATQCKLCCRYMDSTPYSSTATRVVVDVTTAWQRFYISAPLKQAQATDSVWIGQVTDTPIYVYHPKVEVGTKPSDWSLAPEDVSLNIEEESNKLRASYGTCSTAAGTAAKVVTCENFELLTGSRITINFTTANTTAAPTLNVNGTGAALIWYNNDEAASGNPVLWGANATLSFVYDGSHWILDAKPPTYSGSCTTGASTRSKALSVAGALVVNGTTVLVRFSNANTYKSNSVQFNLSSTGAASIWVDNAATSSSRHILWSANTVITFTRNSNGWFVVSRSDDSKTATNFISLTSDGIKIADATPSTASTYQLQTATGTDFVVAGAVMNRINGDGMMLYDGSGTDEDENVVAKFAGNLIELGKNRENTVIRCAENLELSYYHDNNGVRYGNLYSEAQIRMWSGYEDSSVPINQHAEVSAYAQQGEYQAMLKSVKMSQSANESNKVASIASVVGDSGNSRIEARINDDSNGSFIFDKNGLTLNDGPVLGSNGTGFTINGGTPIKAFYAGTDVFTLSNGQWMQLKSAQQVSTLLGSGASQANTICIAQNGDFDTYAGVVTGAMGQDGSARAYIYPNRSGGIRINYILIRFA